MPAHSPHQDLTNYALTNYALTTYCPYGNRRALAKRRDIEILFFFSLSALNGHAGIAKRSCPPKDEQVAADIVFTDYYGLNHLKKKAKTLLQSYKYVLLSRTFSFLVILFELKTITLDLSCYHR